MGTEMSNRLKRKIISMQFSGRLFGYQWVRMPDHWTVVLVKIEEVFYGV